MIARSERRRERHLESIHRHILIVDDQTVDLIAPYTVSMNLGFKVTLAFDGGEALRELTHSKVDLIILDWNMPHTSGAEFLEQLIRREYELAKRGMPKIILFSGQNLRETSALDQLPNNVIEIWKKPMQLTEMAQRLNAISRTL